MKKTYQKILLKFFAITINIILLFILYLPFTTVNAQSEGKDLSRLRILQNKNNLYFFGEDLDIQADTSKSLIVGGGTIKVNSNIGESLWATGNNIDFNGEIIGNALIIGNIVKVSGNIGGDLRIIAREINLDSASVKGNLLLFGIRKVNTNFINDSTTFLRSPFQNYKLNSLPTANSIQTYTLPKLENLIPRISMQDSDNIFSIFFNRVYFTFKAITFFGWIVLGFFILWLFYPQSRKTIENLTKDWKSSSISFGIGLIVSVFSIIMILPLLLSVLGWPILYFMIALGAALWVAGSIFAVTSIGKMISIYINKEDKLSLYICFIIGVVVMAILNSIPVIGEFSSLILGIWGMGGIIKYYYRKRFGDSFLYDKEK